MRSVALDNDCRNVVVIREYVVNRCDVNGSDNYRVQDFLRDSAERLSRFGRRIVVPAVEVLVELHNLGLSRIGAGEPEREVGGLSA